MRRDIREGVKKHMIDGIKPNYTALAEQYGCDYRTVKAAYEEALQGNKPKTRRTYPSKLDSFKQIIDIKLEDQCTAKSIFKFIQKKGFDGSYSLVRDYCRGVKKERIQKATVRVEYTPGLSAQIDWKEEMRLISSQGEVFRFNIFLY
ncbi:IS21 family transposase, partial [Aerococcus viridans]